MAGVGLLSTPYTVKQAGWVSLLVLVLFAVVCCYTATLMRYCFESREGILTYPDIGEAAFGRTGRIIVSVSLFVCLFSYLNNSNASAMPFFLALFCLMDFLTSSYKS